MPLHLVVGDFLNHNQFVTYPRSGVKKVRGLFHPNATSYITLLPTILIQWPRKTTKRCSIGQCHTRTFVDSGVAVSQGVYLAELAGASQTLLLILLLFLLFLSCASSSSASNSSASYSSGSAHQKKALLLTINRRTQLHPSIIT